MKFEIKPKKRKRLHKEEILQNTYSQQMLILRDATDTLPRRFKPKPPPQTTPTVIHLMLLQPVWKTFVDPKQNHVAQPKPKGR